MDKIDTFEKFLEYAFGKATDELKTKYSRYEYWVESELQNYKKESETWDEFVERIYDVISGIDKS